MCLHINQGLYIFNIPYGQLQTYLISDQISGKKYCSLFIPQSYKSSAESKKGINAVQRCSVQNQKAAIARLCVAIMPFWLERCYRQTLYSNCALLVFNRTSLKSVNALFALSRRNEMFVSMGLRKQLIKVLQIYNRIVFNAYRFPLFFDIHVHTLICMLVVNLFV